MYINITYWYIGAGGERRGVSSKSMNMLIRFGDDAFAIDLMKLGWALGYKLLVGWGGVGWKGALDNLSFLCFWPRVCVLMIPIL